MTLSKRAIKQVLSSVMIYINLIPDNICFRFLLIDNSICLQIIDGVTLDVYKTFPFELNKMSPLKSFIKTIVEGLK